MFLTAFISTANNRFNVAASLEDQDMATVASPAYLPQQENCGSVACFLKAAGLIYVRRFSFV